MTDSLRELLTPQRLTEVVDIGANPIDGEPPYAAMLAAGLCRVTGFEPQADAVQALLDKQGPGERYLPYAVGDGGAHVLHLFRTSGMTSLLEPDPAAIALFEGFGPHGEVTGNVELQTRRLDEITEIEHLDFLKIDVQGSELAVFAHGAAKLAQAVVIQTEVSFVTLYHKQPSMGQVDAELRRQGFIPHCFAAIKTWPTTNYGAGHKEPDSATQLLEADLVYVRDYSQPESLTDEQLKHLALIAHHCYRAFDLAMHCVTLLEQRQAWGADFQAVQRYREILGAAPGDPDSVAGAGRTPAKRKKTRDIALLLTDFDDSPDDPWPILQLADHYFELEDFRNARKWYARRIVLDGREEEVYHAMYRLAQSMHKLDEPWPQVQDAYLQAWAFRPTRAEPLHAVARKLRMDQRYQLGYMFARRAGEIRYPVQDRLGIEDDVYAWRALDEQAVCAEWIDRKPEAFALNRRLLARKDMSDLDRQRFAGNRDFSTPVMIANALPYPEALVRGLRGGVPDAEVTVTLIAGPDRGPAETTVNTFLNCCTDLNRVGRFVVVDDGLAAADRAALQQQYGFVEIITGVSELDRLRSQIGGRFWMHLGRGWQFFAPENYITRLTAVLHAEPNIYQVGVNFRDARELIRACAAEPDVRRAPDAGRYALSEAAASGPAMFDTARLDRVDRAGGARQSGMRTATLDEVLCIAAGEKL